MSSFAVIVLLAGFVFAPGAFAAPPVENTQCILGQPGAPNGLNCTANDTTLSSPLIDVVKPCNFPGDTARLNVTVDITVGAQTRYDLAVWLAVDGDEGGTGDGAETGICSVLTVPNNSLHVDQLTTTLGDGDNCGDVFNVAPDGIIVPPTETAHILGVDLGTVDLLCQDTDGDGKIDVPVIVSWKQQANNDCSVSNQAVPGTASKCVSNDTTALDVPIPAQIIVRKTTNPTTATNFDFEITGPVPIGWTGDWDGSEAFQLTDGGEYDSSVILGGLPAGDNYSVVETAPGGWIQTSATCTSSIDGNTDPASLNLRAGEIVTCDFTNTPNTATLTVVKQSIGGADNFSFSGSGSIGNFSLDTTGDNVEQTQFMPVAGTYDLTETVPANWNLTNATCVGATNNGTFNGTDEIAGIQLSGGDNVTCTFVNAADGSISITKLTEGGDGTFNFTSSFITAFSITTQNGSGTTGRLFQFQGQLVGTLVETVPAGWEFVSASCSGVTSSSPIANGVSLTIDAGQSPACTFRNRKLGTIVVAKVTDPPGGGDIFEFTGDAADTIADGEMITVADLSPADSPFDATEVVPAGWDLTDITCDDTNSTGDVGSATANFNLEAGETVTCTFTNTQQAKITVEKQLDGDPTGLTTSFDFTSSFDAPFALDPVNAVASMEFDGLTPDTAYTVTEGALPDGWARLSATCGGIGETVNLATGQISNISPDPGEEVTCIFVNTVLSLVLTKTGTLDDGGDGIANVGDTINYTFSVQNTSNVTLTNIVVADTDPDVTIVGSPIESLVAGATDNSVTGSYVLQQADIDAGFFTNTATATSDEGATDDDDDRQALAPAPALVLLKTGTLNDGGDGTADVGDTITYAFSVENTGNVSLTDIVVEDANPDVMVVGSPIATLAVGATDSSVTGSYVLKQADVDAGTFTNTATATSDEGATDDDDDTQDLSAPTPFVPAIAVPVGSNWALVLLALLLLGVGAVAFRRVNQTRS